MADIEQVIKWLGLCCYRDGMRQCGLCPYGGHTCWIGLRRDAVELLIAQVPRVMTLQEIIAAKHPVYIEKRACEDGDKEWNGWGIVEYIDIGQILFAVIGRDLRLLCEISTMNKYFRCWNAKPTAAQREAVKWDGQTD